jgi:hypothetical protein
MSTRPASPFWLTLGVAWLSLSLLSALWAISTPIGGAPDEPAHLIKAASVARGEFIGSPSKDGQLVTVPEYIAYSQAQTCYAFHPNVTASCVRDVPGDPSRPVQVATTAGLYNPLYYALVGWPSLIAQDTAGIYWMRLVSDVETSLFLALAFALVAIWRRPSGVMLGLLGAIAPMVLFLNGTVNPNAMEIAATLLAFVGVVTIVKEPGANHLPLRSGVVFASAAIAANMRGLSLLWLAIALTAPLALLSWRRIVGLAKVRAIQLAFVGIIVAAFAALVWLFSTNSLAAGTLGGPTPDMSGAPAVGSSHLQGFVWNLFSTFEYGQGMIGVFGWLDTPAPLAVFFIWSVFAGFLILAGLTVLRRRTLLFISILGLALVLLPPIVQSIYITGGGIIWQGRYILPIFVCVMAGTAAVLYDRFELSASVKSRLIAIVLTLWSIAQFESFATALRRYVVGLDTGWLGLLSPQWVPPGGVALLLGVFAFVLIAGCGCLLIFLRRRSEPSWRDTLFEGPVPTLG